MCKDRTRRDGGPLGRAPPPAAQARGPLNPPPRLSVLRQLGMGSDDAPTDADYFILDELAEDDVLAGRVVFLSDRTASSVLRWVAPCRAKALLAPPSRTR